jgi:hypothetical protein
MDIPRCASTHCSTSIVRTESIASRMTGAVNSERKAGISKTSLPISLERATGREGFIMTNYRLNDVGGRQPGGIAGKLGRFSFDVLEHPILQVSHRRTPDVSSLTIYVIYAFNPEARYFYSRLRRPNFLH